MGLFKKKEAVLYPPEQYEPLLKCSICTGEQVACLRDRATGKLREVTLVRDQADLEAFARACRAEPGEIKRIY